MGSFGHAALWGYVDAQGVAHFANRQVDSRYSLVLSDKGAPAVAPDKVPGKTSAPASMLIWLEIAPEVKRVQPWVREAASRHGVDAELINALIAVESGFNDKALSPKGAVGLMQLMPATAHQFGVKNAFNPEENVRAGVAYLRQLLDRYENNETLALAAYNAGPGAVDKYHGVPPYPETINYVNKIDRAFRN